MSRLSTLGTMEEPPFVWTEPTWLEQAVAWVDAELETLERPRTGAIEQPHVRAWSTAMRVPTGEGPVWFKATVPVLAHEAGVIQVLAGALPEAVSILLAADLETGWMLLEDAGDRLREVIDHDPDETLRRWEAVLPLYAELQRAAAPRLDALLAARIPDFTLAAIPRLYEGLLADEAPLRTGDEALTDDQLEALHALAPRVAEICAELAALG